MDSLLKQMYGGFDRFPADMIGINVPEFIHIRDKCYTLHEAFRNKLHSELAEDFDRLIESQVEIAMVGMEEGFTEGFKMGARLIIEILAE